MNKKVIKMFLNLSVFGVLSGVILAGVFSVADPIIKENKRKELEAAIFKVLPEARDYTTLSRPFGGETVTVYVGYNAGEDIVGIAFKADGNGYSGNVGVMVGLDTDYLKLEGIEVLDQLETPGLGDRISEPAFKKQFKGVEVRPRVEYIKYVKPEKANQIQAITGATISSRAVVTNINNAIARVREVFPRARVATDAKAARAAARAATKGGDKKDEEPEERDGE
ncbi:MAG: RnfABCDGE type electron transport complex subunit G [Thermodesulfobacteriota bacterium]